MPAPLSGPGLGLALAQNLYPSELNNAPYDVPTNRQNLSPGDSLVIPAGDWYVDPGAVSIIQYLDPVTSSWRTVTGAAWLGGPTFVKSDGFNYRIANLTGCIISTSITAPGDGNYVQATTSVSVTGATGVSISPIVGGALAAPSFVARGAGYGVAPIVMISAPAPASSNSNGIGGIPATGYCTIQNGTVSGFTFTNPGAGYQTAPTAVVVPCATDPNISTGITAASLTFSLTSAGSITGAIVQNNGAPLTNGSLANVTLTVVGAGASATLTANVLQTMTAATVTGTVSGIGATTSALLTTIGGSPNAGSLTNNPEGLYLSFRPRPAQVGLAVTGVGSIINQVGTIYDGGLFMSAPGLALAGVPVAAAGSVVAAYTLAAVMGSRNDIVTLQPAP